MTVWNLFFAVLGKKIWGLVHARQVLFHWAMCQAPKIYFLKKISLVDIKIRINQMRWKWEEEGFFFFKALKNKVLTQEMCWMWYKRKLSDNIEYWVWRRSQRQVRKQSSGKEIRNFVLDKWIGVISIVAWI